MHDVEYWSTCVYPSDGQTLTALGFITHLVVVQTSDQEKYPLWVNRLERLKDVIPEYGQGVFKVVAVHRIS